MQRTREMLETAVSALKERMFTEAEACEGFVYKTCGYKTGSAVPVPDESWQPWPERWENDEKDLHAWVVGTVVAPAEIPADTTLMLDCAAVDSAPQTLCYLNGRAAHGLDRNHAMIPLTPGERYDVALYVYYDRIKAGDRLLRPALRLRNDLVTKTYFDMAVPYEAAMCFPEGSWERETTFRHLEAACLLIDRSAEGEAAYYDSLAEADRYMRDEFYAKECGRGGVTVAALGQTHLDVAWNWTVDQTKEKAQRSFSTVLQLMEEYPDLIFMQSQPQLYEFIREEDPELYERIRARAAEGRWEAEGAMWLESDCNIPSGESFVRQLIYGKRFLREQFGKESRTLWIPDVFGYSAALPQLLKKAGVEYFVTGKISWNDVNDPPKDSFYWKGLDGTEIFTYFLTNRDFFIDSYFPDKKHEYVMFNGALDPREVKSTYDIYRCKTYNDLTLHTFGFGDGGGGPTWEMMERYERLKQGLPGIPKTEMMQLDTFLDRARENFDRNCAALRETPKWDGELYLEYHRGTYTSVGKVKRLNRRAEFALRDAEASAALSDVFGFAAYPKERFDGMWALMNLNQFHDIIPGSAVGEVYERSEKEYGEVIRASGEILDGARKAIADRVRSSGGCLVFNPNDCEGRGVVRLNGETYTTSGVPALGWAVRESLYGENRAVIRWSEAERRIENEHFRIEFDDAGRITSFFDLRSARELLLPGRKGNEIVVYENFPYHFEAWEISHYTSLKAHPVEKLVGAEIFREKAAAGIRFTWKYRNTTFTQRVTVYDEIHRVDFETEAVVADSQILVKALFPLDVRASKTTSEIQFGNVERPTHRNTSWDEAMFETCMHKWVDLSDRGWGVSFLNDCKYGFSAEESTVGITLIKSADSPFPHGDWGKHEFTYSVYPHERDPLFGGTVQEAFRLNAPMYATAVAENAAGTLPDTFAAVSCSAENVIVDTVKRAENGSGTVLRLYDAYGLRTKAKLTFGFPVREAYLTNLLEEEPKALPLSGGSVELEVGSFEVVTLLVK